MTTRILNCVLRRRRSWLGLLALTAAAWAQDPCEDFRLSVQQGPVLLVFGPVGTHRQIQYTERLDYAAEWRVLTNLVLASNPHELPDPSFVAAPQRFYRSVLPPTLLTEPQSQTVTTGATVVFTAAAAAPCAPMTFQWRRGGSGPLQDGDLLDATNSSLTLANVQAADAGVYTVVVASPGGVVFSSALLRVEDPDTGIPYGTASWPEGLGNHRARVAVVRPTDAVWTRIPWRRKDAQPDQKDIVVIDRAAGVRVANLVRVNVNREFGDLVFQPFTRPGEYDIYYLPSVHGGFPWIPTTYYPPPGAGADPAWLRATEPLLQALANGNTNSLPVAPVLEFQAIREFHRFNPMELVATEAETAAMLAAQPQSPYLLFPEDRSRPIRMTGDLPLHWTRSGPSQFFRGEACRGEFYAFQIGVYAARQPLERVSCAFSDLVADDGARIPATALRCFNLEGTNWLGQRFEKMVNVAQGTVQPLWIGVDIPADSTPQVYRGHLTVSASNAPSSDVEVSLTVTPILLTDRGDAEIWKHSRLRWLDSNIGLDEDPVPPYGPIAETNLTLSVLGREADLAENGLFAQARSFFSRSVDGIGTLPRDLLTGPIRFVAEAGGVPIPLTPQPLVISHRAPGAIGWVATNRSDLLDVRCQGRMECDGYADFSITVTALEALDLDDLRLEVPVDRQVATYLMGLGRRGGLRPSDWQWSWNTPNANNQVWIGDVNAGLCLTLKNVEDRWDLTWLPDGGYRDWANGGLGGCTVTEAGTNGVLIRAFTGPRTVFAGQELQFRFGFLITPVKVLDKAHWQWRHYHDATAPSPATVLGEGATIVNLHHGCAVNPHINYPFLTPEALNAYLAEAHRNGIRAKLYYTVRELSNHTPELWALRSLGWEVLADGFGGVGRRLYGASWLIEHLVSRYAPAWHTLLPNGEFDASLATTGLSRWHNYYLEGLNWLVHNADIDGLYLDGIGYDREITKRLRKVLLRARPDSLIDFHSGNSYTPSSGLISPACKNAEHFPYVDSLWFGEYFAYNEAPDYWLVEVSGIPFGIFSEMLQECGNPWRGMIYGMSSRPGYVGCQVRGLWQLWDQFGIQDARMIGYWDEACPVRTSDPNVLATAYVRTNETLIALASWATNRVDVRLTLDAAGLGFDPAQARLLAPAVEALQDEAVFAPHDLIPVEPNGGWLLRLQPVTSQAR